jgi:hypothetical protein
MKDDNSNRKNGAPRFRWHALIPLLTILITIWGMNPLWQYVEDDYMADSLFFSQVAILIVGMGAFLYFAIRDTRRR